MKGLRSKKSANGRRLTLGWSLHDQGDDPVAWVRGKRKRHYDTADLVQVAASDIAAHTAIIARSGAGKSFLLGNLIEEILLHTKSRCIIFDPNADFRNADSIKPERAWSDAHYDIQRKTGELPYDDFRDFASNWNRIGKVIWLGPEHTSGSINRRPTHQALEIWWPDVDVGTIAEGLDSLTQSQAGHCHQFVKTIGKLAEYKAQHIPLANFDLVTAAEDYFDTGSHSAKDLAERLRNDFSSQNWPKKEVSEIKELIQVAISAPRYVSANCKRFYFGKAKALDAAGVLSSSPPGAHDVRSDLSVLDLPSFSDRDVRRLATSAVLASIWRTAQAEWTVAMQDPKQNDERTPTFVVVDEAHNLMADNPQGVADRALRDQFRTIVAEGRKYGVFLILVTQRPDKIDPAILSECENIILMSLGQSVVDSLFQRMGFDEDAHFVRKCQNLDPGRALLLGRWARSRPQRFYGAMRRTVEGGRNLRADHWARPRADTASP